MTNDMLKDQRNIITGWQIYLNRRGMLGANGARLAEDGIWGRNSAHAMRTLQTKLGMFATGAIDEAVANAARADGMWPFVQARNYTRLAVPRAECRWIVIHTAETPETNTAARGVANYFADQPARGALDPRWCRKDKAGALVPWPGASAHYTVDAHAIYQHVREGDVAWHAEDANRYGIGIEHAGTAAQQEAGWSDAYSAAMLERSAELVAELCMRWDIPRVRITPEQFCAGQRGILGHVDVNTAMGRKGHYDPGPAFPWGRYVARVADL